MDGVGSNTASDLFGLKPVSQIIRGTNGGYPAVTFGHCTISNVAHALPLKGEKMAMDYECIDMLGHTSP